MKKLIYLVGDVRYSNLSMSKELQDEFHESLQTLMSKYSVTKIGIAVDPYRFIKNN